MGKGLQGRECTWVMHLYVDLLSFPHRDLSIRVLPLLLLFPLLTSLPVSSPPSTGPHDHEQQLQVSCKGEWKLLSRVRLFATPRTIQSMEFSRPEQRSGQPFLSLGDLPNPGIAPRSPSLQADSLPAATRIIFLKETPARACLPPGHSGAVPLSPNQWCSRGFQALPPACPHSLISCCC